MTTINKQTKTEVPIDMINDWFILRFHKLPQLDVDYFNQWVERFYTEENAWNSMDTDSKIAWQVVRTARGLKYYNPLTNNKQNNNTAKLAKIKAKLEIANDATRRTLEQRGCY